MKVVYSNLQCIRNWILMSRYYATQNNSLSRLYATLETGGQRHVGVVNNNQRGWELCVIREGEKHDKALHKDPLVLAIRVQ